MISKSKSQSRPARLLCLLPSTFIEVQEAERRNWRKRLPFGGDIDKESTRIVMERHKKLEVSKELKTRTVTKVNNRKEMKIRIKKCLHKNRVLEGTLSDIIKWVNEEISVKSIRITDKQSFNIPNKLQYSFDEEGDIDAHGNFIAFQGYSTAIPFNKGESVNIKSSIILIQSAVLSYARAFSIYSQDCDQFINCLEEYKRIVTQYIKTNQQYENTLKNLNRNLYNLKRHKHAIRPSFYLRPTTNEIWEATNEYFLKLSSECIENLERLSSVDISSNGLSLLNMFAVNRLSAILRALRYCRDNDINYYTFQVFIRDNRKEYLAMLRNSADNRDGALGVYPEIREVEYLLSLRKENIISEINNLCTMLTNEQTQDFNTWQQELSLEKKVEAIAKQNHELVAQIKERILNNPVAKTTNDKIIIDEYRTYISSLKKRKGVQLTDKQCSTDYSRNAIIISQ
jgi:hypothetical protein